MHWTLDTGRTGAVEAKDLTKALEDAKAHHALTAADGIEMEIMAAFNEKLPDAKERAKHMQEVTAQAAAARAKVEKRIPLLQEQMDAAIIAAQDLANHMTGRVTCTIRGHIYKTRSDGIFKRVEVHVDMAAPELDIDD